LHLLLDGVAVESGDRAQPAGHRRPCSSSGFQVTGEALDVSPAGAEQADFVLAAPARELAQIQRVRLADQTHVAGQETC
jgi:hypothetical protein